METIIAAADFFAAKLSYGTDPADLAAIRATGAGVRESAAVRAVR